MLFILFLKWEDLRTKWTILPWVKNLAWNKLLIFNDLTWVFVTLLCTLSQKKDSSKSPLASLFSSGKRWHDTLKYTNLNTPGLSWVWMSVVKKRTSSDFFLWFHKLSQVWEYIYSEIWHIYKFIWFYWLYGEKNGVSLILVLMRFRVFIWSPFKLF